MEVLALVLSTIVSIVAILATAYQTHIQRKINITELYFRAQVDAYNELFKAAAELEINVSENKAIDSRRLIYASQNAMLVSTHRNAKVIEHFCAVFIDFVDAENNNCLTDELIKEFKEAKFILATLLREEMFRFDSMRRKSDKFFTNKEKRNGENQK